MEICGIKFAPLNIPLTRRLQTLGTAQWVTLICLGGVIGSLLVIYLIMYTELRWITAVYLFWIWFIDNKTSERGGRRSRWVRSWAMWGYMKDYFPFKLEKLQGVELDPKKNYLFSVFPHGVIPAGFCSGFGYENSGYKILFPHHIPYVVTLAQQFVFPFSREIFLGLGAISSSSKSIDYVLSRPEGGHACALAVGGAKEAYYCKPGTYRLALKNRKGFVKLALRNGASLVPVISFGESDLYDQVDGKMLRKIQDIVRKWILVAPIIPKGRGFFQYSFGLLPHRRPVTTVVGEPIDVPKIPEPTQEQIDKYHALFMEKLTQLFEEQKYKYLKNPETTNLIID